MMAQKIFRNIYVMFTLVVMSFVVASCDKSEDEFLLNTYNNGGNNNSEITINVKSTVSVRIQPLRLLLAQ